MAKAARNLAGMAVVVAMAMAPKSAAAADVTTSGNPNALRVRSDNPAIITVIQQAAERSSTFRQMLDTINASDAIVYVQAGKCRKREHACFTAVMLAGPSRLMQVLVDTNQADWDLMGSIGHELRHTIEVIAERSVTSNNAMYFFYRNTAVHAASGSFETQAATDAGNAVLDEVRASMRAAKTR